MVLILAETYKFFLNQNSLIYADRQTDVLFKDIQIYCCLALNFKSLGYFILRTQINNVISIFETHLNGLLSDFFEIDHLY